MPNTNWENPDVAEIEGGDVDGLDIIEQARYASECGAEFAIQIPVDL